MSETKEEIRGIDRFFPTPRSTLLFWAIPASLLGVLWQSPKLVGFFFPTLSTETEWVGVLALVFATLTFLLLFLVIELGVYASQNKHKVTRHYKYYAPEMNLKWLFNNARPKHYAVLVLIFLVGCFVGHGI